MKRLLIAAVSVFIVTQAIQSLTLEYDKLGDVPGIDPRLIQQLQNLTISEHEFYHKLRHNYENLTSGSIKLFGEWIRQQDGEIANQYNSESKSRLSNMIRSCRSINDCRDELDGKCFGGGKMRHLCHKAERTSTILPHLLIQERGNETSSWMSINSDEERIQDYLSGSKSVVFVIHGFRQCYKDVAAIHNALVEEASYDTVITVDYKCAARAPSYSRAIANTEVIAYFLYRFIRRSMSALSLKGENVYLVAFSLGTQVAHFAAQSLAEEGILLGRITGLDPSAVLTKGISLTHEDADFVDVIHTSAGYTDKRWASSYLQGKVGIKDAIGHVDFYPNGGGFQPFCRNILRNMNMACHHLMAISYFVASIRSCPYHSYPCATVPNPDAFYDKQCRHPEDLTLWSRMGYHSDLRKKESMWTSQLLYTNHKKPFCEISNPCTTILSCTRYRFYWPE